jgi:hypothetical protein
MRFFHVRTYIRKENIVEWVGRINFPRYVLFMRYNSSILFKLKRLFVLIKTYQITLCLSNEEIRGGLINSLKIMTASICKISPDLQLPKGGITPLFGEGVRGRFLG